MPYSIYLYHVHTSLHIDHHTIMLIVYLYCSYEIQHSSTTLRHGVIDSLRIKSFPTPCDDLR